MGITQSSEMYENFTDEQKNNCEQWVNKFFENNKLISSLEFIDGIRTTTICFTPLDKTKPKMYLRFTNVENMKLFLCKFNKPFVVFNSKDENSQVMFIHGHQT